MEPMNQSAPPGPGWADGRPQMEYSERMAYETAVREAKRQLRKTANRNARMILLFLVGSTLAVRGLYWLLSNVFHWGTQAEQSWATLMAYVLMYLICAPLVILLWNRLKPKQKMRYYFQKPAQNMSFLLRWSVIGIGMTYAASFINNFFFTMLQSIFHMQFQAPALITGIDLPQLFIVLFIVPFAGPLMEELLFRGSMLGRTAQFGEWFAIFAMAVSFGLYHQNYEQIFFAAVFGLILGFVTIKSRSIWPALIMHVVINLAGGLQEIFVKLIGNLEGVAEAYQNGTFRPEQLRQIYQSAPAIGTMLFISLSCLTLAIIGIVLLVREIRTNRHVFKLQNPCPILTGSQKFCTYLSAPWTIVGLVLTLSVTVLRIFGVV